MSLALTSNDKQPPRWKRAFPDFVGMPEGIPHGFNDASWRNEGMPSFVNGDLGLRIWVDYADPARREEPSSPRFCLARVDEEGEALDALVETDEWDDLVEAVEAQAERHPSP